MISYPVVLTPGPDKLCEASWPWQTATHCCRRAMAGLDLRFESQKRALCLRVN